jgi:hypothetical protein
MEFPALKKIVFGMFFGAVFLGALAVPGGAFQINVSTAVVSTGTFTVNPNDGLKVTADLSALADDMGGISKIFLLRGTTKIPLVDDGTGLDGNAADLRFTGSFGLLSGGTVATENFLTQAPFAFELVSDFETNPPIASSLKIQKISSPGPDQKNFKAIAKFEDDNLQLLTSRGVVQFLMEVAGDQVRFRDDGKGGDAVEGDGHFTATLFLSDQEAAKFSQDSATAVVLNRGVETSFIGRSLVQTPVKSFALNEVNTVAPNAGALVQVVAPFAITAQNLATIRERCLIVRDVSVVEDPVRTYDPMRKNKGNPNGVWSFGRLANGLANSAATGVSTKDFLVKWVDEKLFSSASLPDSGDSAAARDSAKQVFIKAWLKNSGVTPIGKAAVTGNAWKQQVKAEEFPVRLLAIVNRVDLRGNGAYGLSNPGEGRFVFCFVDSNKGGAVGAGLESVGTMTLILEYGLPFTTCQELTDYAVKWWDLQKINRGPVYNAALETITKSFTEPGLAAQKPNGSCLNHFRTNEFLVSAYPWMIKDFIITSTGHLDHAWYHEPSVEPKSGSNGPVNGSSELADFVNGLTFDDAAPAPLTFVPDNLKAIAAPMGVLQKGKLAEVVWQGPPTNPMNPRNRREFALATCSGCHTAETNNLYFTHIRPRNIGASSQLSAFLQGAGASNPLTPALVQDPHARKGTLPPKQFNEAWRRAVDLRNLVYKSDCSPTPAGPVKLMGMSEGVGFKPLNMTE